MMQRDLSKRHFVLPATQFKALGAALAFALVLMVAQGIGVAFAVHYVAQLAPERSASILHELPWILTRTALIALVLLVPPVLALVIGGLHKVVGPVARIECYLREHLKGKDVEQLHLRKDDMLQDLAKLVDQVVQQQIVERQRNGAPAARKRRAERQAA
ncbi:MAG: hypothetical protein WD226_01370 [Planctomycetota bacterium]